ncbi:unnamed protein product, partial [Ixodes hexagonus]
MGKDRDKRKRSRSEHRHEDREGHRRKGSDRHAKSLKRERRPSARESSEEPKSNRLQQDQSETRSLLLFRHELSRIFFADNSPIRRNSKQYDDFWTFLKKYEEHKRRKRAEPGDHGENPPNDPDASFGLPRTYDPIHKVNFSVFPGDPKALMLDAGVLIDADDAANSLSEADVSEVRIVFHLFLDFLQRQKFAKLKKLRDFQRNLPIAQQRDAIVEAVRKHQVVLIAGDTGCGKSTQLPQYLLNAGFEGIVCTQPRRIAAIALCKRVAFETLNEYGTHIGYQIRFERRPPAQADQQRRDAQGLRRHHPRRDSRAAPDVRLPSGSGQVSDSAQGGPQGHPHVGHHQHSAVCAVLQ